MFGKTRDMENMEVVPDYLFVHEWFTNEKVDGRGLVSYPSNMLLIQSPV